MVVLWCYNSGLNFNERGAYMMGITCRKYQDNRKNILEYIVGKGFRYVTRKDNVIEIVCSMRYEVRANFSLNQTADIYQWIDANSFTKPEGSWRNRTAMQGEWITTAEKEIDEEDARRKALFDYIVRRGFEYTVTGLNVIYVRSPVNGYASAALSLNDPESIFNWINRHAPGHTNAPRSFDGLKPLDDRLILGGTLESLKSFNGEINGHLNDELDKNLRMQNRDRRALSDEEVAYDLKIYKEFTAFKESRRKEEKRVEERDATVVSALKF